MIRKAALSLVPGLLVAALPLSAAAQISAADAGNAAEAVAARASGAFERVDPDSEMPGGDDVAAVYAGLPPLAGEARAAPEPAPEPASEPSIELVPVRVEDPALRGPAVRMIASEVVQPLPAPPPTTPAPVSAPAPTPVALASNDPFVIKSILPIEGSIRYGDWFWDESAAPRDGKLVITVDLEARVISAFRDGHEIGTAAVLVGTQAHPTPLGTFPILTKEADNVSEKYNDAPMP
jgi:hypothetical protein